jgi:hypothetical protein
MAHARRGDQRLRYRANALRMIANMRRRDLDGKGAVSNSGLVCRIPSHKPGSIDMASVCFAINYSIFQASSGLDLCSQDELMMVKSTHVEAVRSQPCRWPRLVLQAPSNCWAWYLTRYLVACPNHGLVANLFLGSTTCRTEVS